MIRPEELDARGRRLRAALAALLVRDTTPELRLMHEWPRLLVRRRPHGLEGMTHQGWDLQLTAYARTRLRANCFPVGIAHSVVGASAWEPMPWLAV